MYELIKGSRRGRCTGKESPAMKASNALWIHTPSKLHKRLLNMMKNYGILRKIIRTKKEIYTWFKCTIINQGETSEWFKIKLIWRLYHVKNDCRQSHRLSGIACNFTTVFEDLDFADLSSKLIDLDEKTQILTTEACSATEEMEWN